MNPLELLKRDIKGCTYLSHETMMAAGKKQKYIKCIVTNSKGGKDTFSIQVGDSVTLKEVKDAIESRRT